MKKMIVMVVVTLMTAIVVNAQNEDLKHEIGISYGAGVSVIGDAIGNGFVTGIFDACANKKLTNDKQFGSLGLEYFYHLDNAPKLALGGIVTYAQYGQDVVDGDNTSHKYGDRIRRYISVMPALKYSWVNKNGWALYSKAAIGPMFYNAKSTADHNGKDDSYSKVYFMWQASLLGVEFGGKLRGFIELGVGEQGIILAGLKYKF